MRYELTEYEWAAIRPMLPNKPRGVPRRMIDVSSVASFGRWDLARHGVICRNVMAPTLAAIVASAAGGELALWRRLMDALAAAYDAGIKDNRHAVSCGYLSTPPAHAALRGAETRRN